MPGEPGGFPARGKLTPETGPGGRILIRHSSLPSQDIARSLFAHDDPRRARCGGRPGHDHIVRAGRTAGRRGRARVTHIRPDRISMRVPARQEGQPRGPPAAERLNFRRSPGQRQVRSRI